MNQSSLFRLLVRPSFMSGIAVLLTTLGVLGYTSWLYLSNSHILYDTVFGSYGLQDFITQNTDGLMTWQKVLLGSPIAYYFLVGGVAVAAGLIVFTVLQIFSSLFRTTSSYVRQAVDGKTSRSAAWGELFTKLYIRILALVGWAVYAAAFTSMILPFSILLNQTGVEGLHQNNYIGAGLCVVAFVLLLAALHLHILFARLIVLRPRIFGGDAEIAAAETH
jgi:hypothetical protein